MPVKGEGGARDMPLHPHLFYDSKCKTSSVRRPDPLCSPVAVTVLFGHYHFCQFTSPLAAFTLEPSLSGVLQANLPIAYSLSRRTTGYILALVAGTARV